MANEKRLIRLEEAKKLFDDIPPFIGMTGRCVQDMLDKSPTVDAVEVVHGYWVATPVRRLNSKGNVVKYCDFYHCSECGTDRPIVPPYKYCPNCGAKMDGGADNA